MGWGKANITINCDQESCYVNQYLRDTTMENNCY